MRGQGLAAQTTNQAVAGTGGQLGNQLEFPEALCGFLQNDCEHFILESKEKRPGEQRTALGGGWDWVWMAHLGTSCLCLLTGGNCPPKGHRQKKQLTYNSGFKMHSHSHGHGAHKSPQRDKSQDLSLRNSSIDTILEICLLSSLILIDSNIEKI